MKLQSPALFLHRFLRPADPSSERRLFVLSLCTPALLLPVAALTGCSTNSSQSATPSVAAPVLLSGSVHGGSSPIAGAQVLLYAAGSGGYGTPSRSVLSSPTTTDESGNFTISGTYTCQPGDQVYLLATGGQATASNAANNGIALAAALGSCSALTPTTAINVNEVTTVAVAYALAGFMNTATSLSSSGSAVALTGIKNAFLTAANLADFNTGNANTTTAGGNGTVPTAEINTLADILAACVNSTSTSNACSTLFGAATPSGGTAPTDTLTAALNIAHNPGQNVATLFGLATASSPFQPSLSAAPHDWSVALTYTGAGIGTAVVINPSSIPTPNHPLAIDGLGNVWVVNQSGVSVLDPAGNPLSPATAYNAGINPNVDAESIIAIDSSNNAWIGAYTYATGLNPRLIKINSAGTLLSPAGGYTGGGLSNLDAMTFDSLGNLWVAGGLSSDSAAEFSSSGAPISPAGGYAGTSAYNGLLFYPSLTADAAGHVWWVGTEFGQGGTILATQGCGGNSQYIQNAVDAGGNMWTAVPYAPSILLKCGPTGALLSPSTGYTVSPSSTGAPGVAVDGTNRIWFFDRNFSGHLGVMDDSGNQISPAGGYQMGQDAGTGSEYMALDPSGNAWLTSKGNAVVQFVGIASPVVTPLASALGSKSLGTRP